MSTLALGSLSPNIERRKLGRFLTGSFSLKSSDRCLSGSRPWRARDLCLIMGGKQTLCPPRDQKKSRQDKNCGRKASDQQDNFEGRVHAIFQHPERHECRQTDP